MITARHAVHAIALVAIGSALCASATLAGPGRCRLRSRQAAHARHAVEAGRGDPVDFDTQHPQGMVKIGDDVLRVVGRDQDADQALPAAAGRLRPRHRRRRRPSVQVRREGQAARPISRSAKGRSITPAASTTTGATSGCRWRSIVRTAAPIVYRVDPATMKAEEVFRFGDHVGGIVHNTDDKTLHGVTLGLAPLLSLDARRPGQGDQRGYAAGAAAQAQPLAATSTTRTASTSAGARCCARDSTTISRRRTARAFRSAASRSSTCAPTRPSHQDADRAVDRVRACR